MAKRNLYNPLSPATSFSINSTNFELVIPTEDGGGDREVAYLGEMLNIYLIARKLEGFSDKSVKMKSIDRAAWVEKLSRLKCDCFLSIARQDFASSEGGDKFDEVKISPQVVRRSSILSPVHVESAFDLIQGHSKVVSAAGAFGSTSGNSLLVNKEDNSHPILKSKYSSDSVFSKGKKEGKEEKEDEAEENDCQPLIFCIQTEMTVKPQYIDRILEIVVKIRPLGSDNSISSLSPSDPPGSKLKKLYKQSLINQNLQSNQIFEVRKRIVVTNPMRVTTKSSDIGLSTVVNIVIENTHPSTDLHVSDLQFHIDSTTKQSLFASDNEDDSKSNLSSEKKFKYQSLFRCFLDKTNLPLQLRPGEAFSSILNIEPKPQSGEITALSVSGNLSSLLTISWKCKDMNNHVMLQHPIYWSRPAETDFLISLTYDSPITLFSIFKVEVSVTNLTNYNRNLDLLLPQSHNLYPENRFTTDRMKNLGIELTTEDLYPLICLEASLPLGNIPSRATASVKLHCVALRPGLVTLENFILKDKDSKINYKMTKSCKMFVSV